MIDVSRFKTHYRLIHRGEIVSTNKFYSAQHWAIRSGIKNKFRKIFEALILETNIAPLTEFVIVLKYNSRHDVDNLGVMVKLFTDTLTQTERIPEDTPKHFKGLTILHDTSLEKNTVEFNLYGN